MPNSVVRASPGVFNMDIPASGHPKRGIFWRILSLFKYAVKYSLNRSNVKEIIPKGVTLFFATAQNEVLCMEAIQKTLDDGYLMNNETYKNSYPIGAIYRGSIKYIPFILIEYFKCKDKYLNKSFLYAFDGFCLAIASKKILKNYLLKLNPKQIIISNHLSGINNCRK